MIQSKALEVNIADYHVEVAIDSKYETILEALSRYFGLREGLMTFLAELSHPYRNWQFIVKEARNYSLNYFHLLKSHPKGGEAARLFTEIYAHALESAASMGIKADAADNLLLFLQKIITGADADIEKFVPALQTAFHRIAGQQNALFFLFVKSYYQIKRLAQEILRRYPPEVFGGFRELNLLLIKYFQYTYTCWLAKENPGDWLLKEAGEIGDKEKFGLVFKDICHDRIGQWNRRLYVTAHSGDVDSVQVTERLLELPGYIEIVEIYRNIPSRLLAHGEEKGQGNQWKLLFLFHIMGIFGLSSIHEETLRDINRVLSWLVENEKYWNIDKLIQKTFSILKDQTEKYPTTALNCVLNMGRSIYRTDDIELIDLFVESVVDLGFQTPKIRGVGSDWQVEANSAHILNIQTWLELIELNPRHSVRLLSSLIVYLSLFGIFIKDTDLFPREITKLLNADIAPVYNLIKQLARLFPIYFNDIGAEGVLREVSTELDEITNRKDPLVHFLRKQSHVESSNRIIPFMEAVFEYWKTKNKEILKPFIPPDIYDQTFTSGIYVDGMQRLMTRLDHLQIRPPKNFLTLQENEIRYFLEDLPGVSETDIKRLMLAVSLYKLLYQKYSLDFVEIQNYLSCLSTEAFPGLDRLKEALDEKDLRKKLYLLLQYLNHLKSLILSDEMYEAREDIYKKRHITVDIPSVYGSYREKKFDALGLTFRIESLVNALFDDLINEIDLTLITKAAFHQIYAVIRLFNEALALDGIASVEMERQLDLLAHSLEAKGFTFTQYLDIFKGFAQALRNIVSDHFQNVHEKNLNRILSMMPLDELLSRFMPKDDGIEPEKLRCRVSEIFFRDRITLSPGLQQLDLFISRIFSTLFHQATKLPKDNLHQLLLYDPESATLSIDHADGRLASMINLGNKGYNMVMLKNCGLPVPSGFIVTTEAFRCREVIDGYSPAERNFKEKIARHIKEVEKIVGKKFGSPENPLLFSVRSGATISQPGMMDTLLDVGINEDIINGMAAKTANVWFAWDNYRRFLQCFGMSFGMERDDFDAVMNKHKKELGKPLKRLFSGSQMRDIALAYKRLVEDAGFMIPADPFEQLCVAIKNVFRSWESPIARTYRKIMGISDDWGTAVTVQSMVYGNISHTSSGTGVFFTHNPRWSGDTLRLWGDFTIGNQGEDVVLGLVKTMPISIIQQDTEMRETDITLESHFPYIYMELKRWANELIYSRGWSPQEMEFTFESPQAEDLYLLQTRDMAMRERKDIFRFDLESIPEDRYLGHGIGVSGGAMSGRAVYSLEEIDKWRKADPNASLILLRADTVPDDIREINACDGLLTARGGLTSHAAVVAHRLGKTCVVGCGDLYCNEKEGVTTINQVKIKSGDFISIDGHEGTVYRGKLVVKRGR